MRDSVELRGSEPEVDEGCLSPEPVMPQCQEVRAGHVRYHGGQPSAARTARAGPGHSLVPADRPVPPFSVCPATWYRRGTTPHGSQWCSAGVRSWLFVSGRVPGRTAGFSRAPPPGNSRPPHPPAKHATRTPPAAPHPPVAAAAVAVAGVAREVRRGGWFALRLVAQRRFT
jgi:hypothetical protein